MSATGTAQAKDAAAMMTASFFMFDLLLLVFVRHDFLGRSVQCFIPEYFSFPFFRSCFFISTKITGVMMRMWIAEEIIPLIMGAAIGGLHLSSKTGLRPAPPYGSSSFPTSASSCAFLIWYSAWDS